MSFHDPCDVSAPRDYAAEPVRTGRGVAATFAVLLALFTTAGCDDKPLPTILERCPIPNDYDASLVEGAGVTCKAEPTTPGLPYGCVVSPTTKGSVCAPGSVRPVSIDCAYVAMGPYLQQFDCVYVIDGSVGHCCATGPEPGTDPL